MSFSNFQIPNHEEIQAVLQLAENNPEFRDGREMWIYQMLKGGDF